MELKDGILFSKKKLPSGLVKTLQNLRYGDLTCDPVGTLTRKEYDDFKTIVNALRGTWNRKTHVFPVNPRPLIEAVLEQGCYPEVNPGSFFPTPETLGKEALDFGGFYEYHQPGFKILEPSAGSGNLAKLIIEAYPDADLGCVEGDPFNVQLLASQGFKVTQANFLDLEPDPVYDWVIMSPPFANKHGSGDFISHINHAYKFLKPNGRLISIAPTSLFWRTGKKYDDLRNLIAGSACGAAFQTRNEQPFKDAGTTIEVGVIVLSKDSEAVVELYNTPNYGYANQFVYLLDLHLDSEIAWHECLESKPAPKQLVSEAKRIVLNYWKNHDVALRFNDGDEYWLVENYKEFLQ
jgi:hypothetical protein